MSGQVIVCGLHYVGLRVIEQLHAAGEQVTVVDDEPDARLLRIVTGWGTTHHAADPRRETALVDAGITDAAALICTAEDELENLEIALLAHRLRPDLRVVVHLRNTAVGRAVGALTGPGSVLDVAALAAPTLAEVCLAQPARSIDIGGDPFLLRELRVPSDGTLREHFGELVPIAVVPHDGSEMAVCPGRDLEVHAGDRAVVLGAAGDDALAVPAAPQPHRVSSIRRYVSGFVAETDRAFRITLALLLVVAVLSVVLLRIGYSGAGRRMTVLDAVYFTTETLTTVGFGDYSFADQSTWLRIWAVVLMIVGATVVTVLYALLTNLLVSRRIAQSFGRQDATRMSGHVIVVGLGAVGLRVLEYLVAAGVPAVVIEHDEDNRFLARARALHVPVVFGDGTVSATLDAANLGAARAVAVLTSSDLANIEAALAIDDLLGERAEHVPIVLRVFDRDLAHTIEASFGFRWARSTSALAAPWFVGAALGLDILQTFYVDQQPLVIGRLGVDASSGLAGRAMVDLSAAVRVIAVRRARDKQLSYPLRRDSTFGAGDQAYVVGPYEELLRLLRPVSR